MALAKRIGVVASVVLLSAGLVACNKGPGGSVSPPKPGTSNSTSANPSHQPGGNPSGNPGTSVDWAPFVGKWDFVADGTTAKTVLTIDAQGNITAEERGKSYKFKGTLTSSGAGMYVLVMKPVDAGAKSQTLAITKGADDKTYSVSSDNGQRGTLTKVS